MREKWLFRAKLEAYGASHFSEGEADNNSNTFSPFQTFSNEPIEDTTMFSRDTSRGDRYTLNTELIRQRGYMCVFVCV